LTSIALGLPRGGVPVGCEVAAALDLSLDDWEVVELLRRASAYVAD